MRPSSTALAWMALLAGLFGLGSAAGPASAQGGAATAPGVPRLWAGLQIRSLDTATAGVGAARLRPGPVDQSSPAAVPSPGVDELLSDEQTFTRWAQAVGKAGIYKQPDASSGRVTRLRRFTEDGFPEVYLLLSRHFDAAGQQWIKLRIPMRPNGSVGWVHREALGAFNITHKQLVVNRRRLRIFFRVNGRVLWSAPVAVGRRSSPTPAGRFWIRERFKISDPRSGYGPYAFGTSDYSVLTDWPGGGVIGIHGPYHEPQAIPGHVSHGCIRLRVTDDAWLAHHLGRGTPLQVL